MSSRAGSANLWASLRRTWIHIQLPGCRELAAHHTYDGFDLERLPPIPFALNEDCSWLIAHGTAYPTGGLDRHKQQLQPAFVEKLAIRSGLDLPESFRRFMRSSDLQSRVRSCTDCYLDPGERVVETVGQIPGKLIHFLSDSQSCVHWYLHTHISGQSAVLASWDLFCYLPENSECIRNPACRLDQIDLSSLDFMYCAPSFSEFLYRFWIENEIWYALEYKPTRALNQLEQSYVAHYVKSS